MFVHPWDIADEGPESVLELISSTGVKEVNLAVSYHAGRYLLQRNPKKKVYFAEEGVVYFQPEASYYRKCLLKPRRSSEYREVDVLALLLAEAARFGMKVNGWTVTLHNSAFARGNPDLAVRDAFGGINYNHLCPSNPEVRRYHAALVDNLLDYQLNSIQLESSCFPGAMQHGDHHETFGVQVEPLVSELMTVCFCDDCQLRAKRAGLDLAASRKVIREVIETSIGLPSDVLAGTPPYEAVRTSQVLSSTFDQIHDVKRFQREVVAELFSEARDTIRDRDSKTKLRVISTGGVFSDFVLGRGAGGISLARLAGIVDGADVMVYVRDPALVHYLTRWSVFEAKGCPVYTSIRTAFPVLISRDSVVESITGVFDAGASGVDLYNYGWTPTRNFEWIDEGLRQAKG